MAEQEPRWKEAELRRDDIKKLLENTKKMASMSLFILDSHDLWGGLERVTGCRGGSNKPGTGARPFGWICAVYERRCAWRHGIS